MLATRSSQCAGNRLLSCLTASAMGNGEGKQEKGEGKEGREIGKGGRDGETERQRGREGGTQIRNDISLSASKCNHR